MHLSHFPIQNARWKPCTHNKLINSIMTVFVMAWNGTGARSHFIFFSPFAWLSALFKKSHHHNVTHVIPLARIREFEERKCGKKYISEKHFHFRNHSAPRSYGKNDTKSTGAVFVLAMVRLFVCLSPHTASLSFAAFLLPRRPLLASLSLTTALLSSRAVLRHPTRLGSTHAGVTTRGSIAQGLNSYQQPYRFYFTTNTNV